ncbi:MAG: dihydroorotate dehydrogenase electron transfer subunit [Thermoleophilia bacterium]
MDAPLIPASLYDCPVVESRPVGAYRLLSLVAREVASLARPGQFMMVRAAGQSLDPLLPRPICVHEIDSDLVKVLIEPVGRGTVSLADLRVGDRLSVLGPLGNGFDITASGPALVVGGGIGAAPLAFLARALAERGREVRCLLGFRTRGQAVAGKLFRDVEVDIFTEDGSMGKQGLISEPLPGCLAEMGSGPRGEGADSSGQEGAEIFACGPDPMLAAVTRVARDCGAPAQLSVAAHMACGVGACQGCVINTTSGYRRVCSEGPVFAAGEIAW